MRSDLLRRANLARRFKCRGRAIKRFVSHLWDTERNPKISRIADFENNERLGVSETREAESATDVGVNIVGDYEHRTPGRSTGGKYARFECGNTSQSRKDCPV